MNRRAIREHIFLMLFRKDFHDSEDLLEQIQIYLSHLEEPTIEEKAYLNNRLLMIVERLDEIDRRLSTEASGWTLSRMGKVELTVLRLAVYEMHFDDDIPVKVAINEAVELAKEFGGDETPGFVNGILAKLT